MVVEWASGRHDRGFVVDLACSYDYDCGCGCGCDSMEMEICGGAWWIVMTSCDVGCASNFCLWMTSESGIESGNKSGLYRDLYSCDPSCARRIVETSRSRSLR